MEDNVSEFDKHIKCLDHRFRHSALYKRLANCARWRSMVHVKRFQKEGVHHAPNSCENNIVRGLIGSVKLLRVGRHHFPAPKGQSNSCVAKHSFHGNIRDFIERHLAETAHNALASLCVL